MSTKLLTNLLFKPKGKHDPALTYSIKDTVMSPDGSKVYFALRDVPSGIALTDENYWMLQIDLSATKSDMESATDAANTAADNADAAAANVKADVDRLTEEIDKKVVAGIGPFVTSDSLPVIEDADTATPNRITAIAKSDYVANMPGTGPDSQGTLLHFAHATNTAANCQVQMLVTPERKVWIRNLWSTDDGWRSWVQLETKVTFYVGGDKATHTRLVDAVNDANALPDHIHVDIMVCQNVNLYVELGGEAFVQSVTETPENMQGVLLRDHVDLIGVGMHTISLVCPDDVATYKFTEEVSVLNLNANNKLSGIIFVGKNVRYVIHDEGGGNGDYNRIVENCYFYHNGTYDGGWNSGQAYGAGTGHSGSYLFDGCVFEGTKMPFSIHNNHNVQRPIVKLVNCVLKGGAGYLGARFGTYGSGYVQGNVYLNGCRSSGVIRTVTEGDYDTFNAGGFQIIPGDTVYRTDLAKLTYYAGNDVWKEI
ncbi:MAG: hypothetical protein J6K73_03000 [Clostridia bacterium]|nr:hypothetical protein [Clostridia bacterium]